MSLRGAQSATDAISRKRNAAHVPAPARLLAVAHRRGDLTEGDTIAALTTNLNIRPRRLCAVHVVIRGRQSGKSPSVETARCIPAPAYSPAVAHRPPDAKKAAIRNRRPFARKNLLFDTARKFLSGLSHFLYRSGFGGVHSACVHIIERVELILGAFRHLATYDAAQILRSNLAKRGAV